MALLIIQPSVKDTYIREANPTNNYGGGADFQVWCQDASRNARSVLEFENTIPAGATLSVATLSLRAAVITDAAGRTYWAYKLTRTDWVELEATWNIYKSSNNWTAAGGDYATSTPSGGSAIVPASDAWMDFNVLAIVQDAYDNTNPIEFLIRDETESQDATFRRTVFRSREYTTDETEQPKLAITYTLPAVPAGGSPLAQLIQAGLV